MNKEVAKKHLKTGVTLLEKTLEVLEKEIEEMKPTVNINNIGQFVKMEIEAIELKEKIKRMNEELDEN